MGTKAIREFNVHDIGHYVHDPRVHIPIFRALFGFEAIDETTAHTAIEEYDKASFALLGRIGSQVSMARAFSR